MTLNLNNKTILNKGYSTFGGNTIGTFAWLNNSVGVGISLNSFFSNSTRHRPSPKCRGKRLVSPQTNILLNKMLDLKHAQRHAAKNGIRNNSTIAGVPLSIADKNIIKQHRLASLATFFEKDVFQEICGIFHKFFSPEFKYTFIVFDGDGIEIFCYHIDNYISLFQFTSDVFSGLFESVISDSSEGDTGATFYLIKKDVSETNDGGVNSAFLQKLKTTIIKKETKTTHFSP